MGNPWNKRRGFLTHLLRSVGKQSLAKGRKEGETLIWGAELNHEGLEIGGDTPAGK